MSNYPEQPKIPPKTWIVCWRGGTHDCNTYEVEDGYVVADKDEFWLPGVYDSHETARDAAALGRDACHVLNEAANAAGRIVTADDVKGWNA